MIKCRLVFFFFLILVRRSAAPSMDHGMDGSSALAEWAIVQHVCPVESVYFGSTSKIKKKEKQSKEEAAHRAQQWRRQNSARDVDNDNDNWIYLHSHLKYYFLYYPNTKLLLNMAPSICLLNWHCSGLLFLEDPRDAIWGGGETWKRQATLNGLFNGA